MKLTAVRSWPVPAAIALCIAVAVGASIHMLTAPRVQLRGATEMAVEATRPYGTSHLRQIEAETERINLLAASLALENALRQTSVVGDRRIWLIIAGCGVVFLVCFGLGMNFRRRSSLILAPGGSLSAIAEFLVSPKVYQQTFEPLIADLVLEWREAMASERLWKACWIRCRYTISFLLHFAALSGVSVGKLFERMWRLF